MSAEVGEGCRLTSLTLEIDEYHVEATAPCRCLDQVFQAGKEAMAGQQSSEAVGIGLRQQPNLVLSRFCGNGETPYQVFLTKYQTGITLEPFRFG